VLRYERFIADTIGIIAGDNLIGKFKVRIKRRKRESCNSLSFYFGFELREIIALIIQF
jgi:hypothetical protein